MDVGPAGASFRANLDDARQAFRLSLERDDVHDAVEIAFGASFLWRNTLGCAEGNVWVRDLLALPLSPEDEVWLHVLRADVGQGRGRHRQMFAAASLASRLNRRIADPAAGCIARHYTAIGYLTDDTQASVRMSAALELAHEAGDPRLAVLVEAYAAVAGLAAGRREQGRAVVERLDRSASEDGYDRFILNWAGWIIGLAKHDGVTARCWMDRQSDFLARSGIVETWLSTFSSAMCDVLDGGDVHATLRRTLALADWEGYQAYADCLLVLAYAEVVAGRLDAGGSWSERPCRAGSTPPRTTPCTRSFLRPGCGRSSRPPPSPWP